MFCSCYKRESFGCGRIGAGLGSRRRKERQGQSLDMIGIPAV